MKSSSSKNIIDALIAAFHPQRENILSESILQTSFVFEKYRGIGDHLSTVQQAATLGWPPEVISTAISHEDIGRLKAAVIRFISDRPVKTLQGEAIWALGKLVDRTAKPVFVAALHAQLDNDQHAMYQAMIALANIGEDVFAGRGSLSSLDVTELRVLALTYLVLQRHFVDDDPRGAKLPGSCPQNPGCWSTFVTDSAGFLGTASRQITEVTL